MSDTQEKALSGRINSLTSPGCYSQGPKKNFFIWSALNLVTLTHAFESTCLCVTLPVITTNLLYIISSWRLTAYPGICAEGR
jgi:hypothetical protein